MSSISDSGHHIPIPGTAVWPFSSTLCILQDYDRNHMLVNVMGINLCQYLDDWLIYSPSHDQCIRDTVQVLNHTMGLLIHDKKSEPIPNRNSFSGIPVRPNFLPSHSNSGTISQNQALICSFLLNQGECAHTWQILLGLFASTEKMVPLGRLHTREAQHCISQHWDFNVLTSNLWILFPPPRRKISNGGNQHIMFCGEPQLPRQTRHSVVHGCTEHRQGSTLECLMVSGVWTTTEKTLHTNVLELEPCSTGCGSLGA